MVTWQRIYLFLSPANSWHVPHQPFEVSNVVYVKELFFEAYEKCVIGHDRVLHLIS